LDLTIHFSISGSRSEKNASWSGELEQEVLRFTLGGHELHKLPLRAVTLTTPFTKLTTEMESNLPPWESLPKGIDAAVVPAQPVAIDPPHLTFLSNAIRYVPGCSNRYFIDLQGSFAAYLRKFSAKSRKNLRRDVRKFAEFSGGQIQWRELRSPAEISEFCSLAIEISPKTWQERAGGPGFPRTEGFRNAMMDLAAEGLARGYVLCHDGRPISYLLCRAYDDCLLYARPAYDKDYADCSPGRVLLYLVLKSLFVEARYRYLDFGDGTLPYKQFFSTGYVRCARVIYFRRTFYNLAIAMSHHSLSSISRGSGRLLKVIGLKVKCSPKFRQVAKV
jgi:CelD/BcsL family acetyltransferase involved in cellulose biosynthesis